MKELVSSFDSTSIAATRHGNPDDPAVLVVNGIGAADSIWSFVVPKLVASGRSVVMWDYRGLHSSGPPVSDRIDPAAHAEDAIAVIAHLGVRRYDVLAWSTGGRVAVEITARDPARIESVTLVCASAAQPLRRLVRSLELTPLLPAVAGIAKHFSGALEGALRSLVLRPEFAGIVRQSGMLGPTGDVPALVEHARDLARCDTRTLLAIYEAVVGDSGESLLPSLEPPVVILAGARDRWSPPGLLEEQARRIPGSRFEVYEGATHFLPIEFPERLVEELTASTP